VLLATAACSGSSAPANNTAAVSPSVSAPASPAPGSLTAAQVVANLKAAGLPIGAVTVYTKASDPDHLLGSSNEYTSKAGFVDKDAPASEAAGQGGGISAGGAVEVFNTAAEATARKQYILNAESSGQTSTTEYDVINGAVLLRLSQDLTTKQVQAFATALG
jgi:hypothetical protein